MNWVVIDTESESIIRSVEDFTLTTLNRLSFTNPHFNIYGVRRLAVTSDDEILLIDDEGEIIYLPHNYELIEGM